MKKYLIFFKYFYFAALTLLVFFTSLAVQEKLINEAEYFFNNHPYVPPLKGGENRNNPLLTPPVEGNILNTPLIPLERGILLEEFPSVTLLAVGDIMLSRNVAAKMVKYQNWTYPFLKTANLLKSADITFGNLETAITAGRTIKTGEMVFRTDPKAVEGLKFAGFDVLSLANNHTPNFGETGLKDTFQYLSAAGIAYIGAGENIAAARQPVIKEVQGLEFAFLAYNDNNVVPPSYFAGDQRAGTVFMDREKMKEDVFKAKQTADFVIVSMHAGVEYQPKASERQKDFARQAIEAGAALVLGHHPHVIEPMEKYKDGYIFYSLGNFIFDQMWSLPTRQGLMATITFTPSGISEITYQPVIIEDYAQPRLANDQEAAAILKLLD